MNLFDYAVLGIWCPWSRMTTQICGVSLVPSFENHSFAAEITEHIVGITGNPHCGRAPFQQTLEFQRILDGGLTANSRESQVGPEPDYLNRTFVTICKGIAIQLLRSRLSTAPFVLIA